MIRGFLAGDKPHLSVYHLLLWTDPALARLHAGVVGAQSPAKPVSLWKAFFT